MKLSSYSASFFRSWFWQLVEGFSTALMVVQLGHTSSVVLEKVRGWQLSTREVGAVDVKGNLQCGEPASTS
jgi:hypothetical protein